jgi:hypothetical protein
MKNKELTSTLIRSIARILGSLFVLAGLFIFGSELIEDLSGGSVLSANDTSSGFIALLLLHGAYIIGYSIAWKWEGLGGLIAIVGILLAQLISPSPTSMFLGQLLFTIPGILYIVYWFLARRQVST